MSKRPTTIFRNDSANTSNSSNTFGYAIIGNTTSATLYAKRLLANKITVPITLINEGVDRANVDGITDIDFVANNNRQILRYLTTERIHLIPYNSIEEEDTENTNTQIDQVIQYHVGAGPLGDFVSAYHIPRVGPWFTYNSSGRLDKFLAEFTIQTQLNNQEKTIVNYLKNIWGIPLTNSLVVKGPSILNSHYTFLEQHDDRFIRELFLDQFHMINHASNVDVITETSIVQFTPGTGTTGLYDINSTNTSLQNVKLIWKTNPYTYLRLATNGGLNPKPLQVPTFYRAVISIPSNGTGATGSTGGFTGSTGSSDSSESSRSGCHTSYSGHIGSTGHTGVNLISIIPTDDLITTHITFSLHDLTDPKRSSLTWLVQVYTTMEDLSIIDPAGKYADDGFTLLIVEAICTKNKRRVSYNTPEHEAQVNYNSDLAELGYLTQFAEIVSTVYTAYTGVTLPVSTLMSDSSLCSASGTCQDGDMIVDYSLRQSPMVAILELASTLYGVEIYPALV